MSGKGRNKGRRLLALRNLIASESDPAILRKLRKEEVLTLAELDNFAAARTEAQKLMADFPEWHIAYAVAADISSRMRDWAEAEKLFSLSAEAAIAAGRSDSAQHVRLGPLFRLTEARSAHDICLVLASGADDLSTLLTARTLRRKGADFDLQENAAGYLESRILLLESAWKGVGLEQLPEAAAKWGGPEPEWRWRFIVEGFDLTSSAGLPPERWRPAVTGTASQILDPRFTKERHHIYALLGLG